MLFTPPTLVVNHPQGQRMFAFRLTQRLPRRSTDGLVDSTIRKMIFARTQILTTRKAHGSMKHRAMLKQISNTVMTPPAAALVKEQGLGFKPIQASLRGILKESCSRLESIRSASSKGNLRRHHKMRRLDLRGATRSSYLPSKLQLGHLLRMTGSTSKSSGILTRHTA